MVETGVVKCLATLGNTILDLDIRMSKVFLQHRHCGLTTPPAIEYRIQTVSGHWAIHWLVYTSSGWRFG